MEIITSKTLLEIRINKTIERISFIKSDDIAIFGYIYDNINYSSFSSSSLNKIKEQEQHEEQHEEQLDEDENNEIISATV